MLNIISYDIRMSGKIMLSKKVFLVILCISVADIVAIGLLKNINKAHVLLFREQVNQILQSCFQNHLNPLVITQQSSDYISYKPKQALVSSSMIMISDEFKIENNTKNYNPHIGTFLLTASSVDQLNRTLSKLQLTPWWNTESYFFVIGPSTHSCAEASKLLSIIWKKKILSAVYLCYHFDREAVMLYTFNPFTNYAPDPWKWVEDTADKSNPRWTLYEHQYQGDQKICPVIMFDKTLRLDGYVISAIMDKKAHDKNMPTGVPIRLSDYTQHIYSKRITVTMNDVFSHMNVKLNITDSDYLNCCLQKNDEKHLKMLENLLDNAILLRPQPMYLGYHYVTYPDARVLMVLLGQKRPFLKTEDKIFSFFHSNILLPIITVFIISAIVLKINRQQEYTLALLKIWQLSLGSYISQKLNNTPTRIFFIGVFWLVIILNGTFQSKLASFLTKPERIYVKDIEDAFKLQYSVYGPIDYMTGTGYLELPAEKQKHLHFVDTDRCVAPVLNNSQALCLTNPNYGTTNAKKYGLYLSPPVLIFYTSYWVSPGFPLKKRIDSIILHLQVTGLTGRVLNQVFFERLGFLQAQEYEETKFNRRAIQLHDLMFIFKFLTVGLICSLIIFIVELWYRRICA